MNRHAKIYHYSLPLREPLLLPGHELNTREGLLLKLGNQWGEIAPLPGFSRESLQDAQDELIEVVSRLQDGLKAKATQPSVQFGLDCAQYSWPSAPPKLLAPRHLLQGRPDRVAKHWRQWFGPYPKQIKVKVGRYPIAHEVALINELCRLAPDSKLILDANRSWTKEEAWSICNLLDNKRIDYVEEPCATLEENRFIATHTSLPVALDEYLSEHKKIPEFDNLKAVILKPTLIGSIDKCKQLIKSARERGARTIISSSFESTIGINCLSRLAAEWAPGEVHGIDTLKFFSHDLVNPPFVSTEKRPLLQESELNLVWQNS
ncbi:o-succinylbenzoate synthase [Dongshaea marina]|uniref:o-succinylbenzoate synthase n=1 Tax=Dongshaea marina TaxID=2047966 RepID=UPI000D3EB6D8|nr:o-succinylbenzoate synthase [Dongshaea marina]